MKKKLFKYTKQIIIAPFIIYLYNLLAVNFNGIIPINYINIVIVGIFGKYGMFGEILYFFMK